MKVKAGGKINKSQTLRVGSPASLGIPVDSKFRVQTERTISFYCSATLISSIPINA